MLNEREIKVRLEDRIEDITNILAKGRDVELRADKKEIVKVISVNKKEVAKE